jgi:hypothetical protein
MSTDIYLTPAASAVVSSHGWRQLPSGTWVTAIPLLDARTLTPEAGPPLFAHLDYEQLLIACDLLGATPLRPATVVELDAHGLRLEPFTISPDSATRAACVRHDTAVWELLAKWWTGIPPVANAGKPWVAGAPPGRGRLMGWSRRPGASSLRSDAYSEWLQPLQVAHNRQHVDYSSLCTVERLPAPEAA